MHFQHRGKRTAHIADANNRTAIIVFRIERRVAVPDIYLATVSSCHQQLTYQGNLSGEKIHFIEIFWWNLLNTCAYGYTKVILRKISFSSSTQRYRCIENEYIGLSIEIHKFLKFFQFFPIKLQFITANFYGIFFVLSSFANVSTNK